MSAEDNNRVEENRKDIAYDIIDAAKAGDADAVNKIFNYYKYLIRIKSAQYFIVGADKEDVYQEAMIGLLKAIRYYDKDKHVSFKTFADICIQRHVFTAVSTAHAKKNYILQSENNEDAKGENQLEEVEGGQSNPEEMFISKEMFSSFESFMYKNLSKFEIRVYKLLILGYDYNEISKRLKTHKKTVDNAIQRIRKKGAAWMQEINVVSI